MSPCHIRSLCGPHVLLQLASVSLSNSGDELMPFVQAKVRAVGARDDVTRHAPILQHLAMFWTLWRAMGLLPVADRNPGVALQNLRAMGCIHAALTRSHLACLAPQRGLDLLAVFAA